MILFIIGLLSGIIGGLGIGGGTILIPALDIFTNTDQHIAQSVNLLSFIPMAIAALITHFKNKNLLFDVIIYLILGGITGSIMGSYMAVTLSSLILKKLFSVFLLFMGVYEVLYKERNSKNEAKDQIKKNK